MRYLSFVSIMCPPPGTHWNQKWYVHHQSPAVRPGSRGKIVVPPSSSPRNSSLTVEVLYLLSFCLSWRCIANFRAKPTKQRSLQPRRRRVHTPHKSHPTQKFKQSPTSHVTPREIPFWILHANEYTHVQPDDDDDAPSKSRRSHMEAKSARCKCKHVVFKLSQSVDDVTPRESFMPVPSSTPSLSCNTSASSMWDAASS